MLFSITIHIYKHWKKDFDEQTTTATPSPPLPPAWLFIEMVQRTKMHEKFRDNSPSPFIYFFFPFVFFFFFLSFSLSDTSIWRDAFSHTISSGLEWITQMKDKVHGVHIATILKWVTWPAPPQNWWWCVFLYYVVWDALHSRLNSFSFRTFIISVRVCCPCANGIKW